MFTQNATPSSPARASGIIIVSGAVIMVAFMAMHPQVHSHDVNELAEAIERLALVNRIVHGTLIAVGCMIVLGFIGFAEQLGLHRLLVRGGLLAYAAGWIALAGAATMNGLVVPAIASDFRGDKPGLAAALSQLLALCHEINQALSQVGTVALSISVFAWSIELLHRAGALRAIGIAGLIIGTVPVVALVTGHLSMNLHGFGAFIILQALWYAAVGVQLARGRI